MVRLTLGAPPHEAAHSTAQAMARAAGLADLESARPRAASLRRCKLSTDPAFAEKLRDVVGLYVAPPMRWCEVVPETGAVGYA